MSNYYIFGKRRTLFIVVSAFALLGMVVGYIFGYQIGAKKAYAREVILPAPKVISEPVTPINTAVEEVIEPEPLPATDEEINLLALITMAEAEGESDDGKRLVIDTILNRVDSGRFPDTIHDVIYAPGQFECTWNGRLSGCYVKDDIRQLVIEELRNRTRNDIHYFRAGHYHGFGKPITRVGNHYFSTY